MASKLLIGILIGFAFGGGMTYFSYGNELQSMVNETIGSISGIGDGGNVTEPREPVKVESKYKDCDSLYDYKKFTGKDEYSQEAWEVFWQKIDCNRYNQNIAQAEHDKKRLEEQMKISRGY